MSGVPAELAPSTRRALEEGIALFDAARFFDAHEVWEDAWRVEAGAARELLQGLIQIAAGFHKGLVQGRPAGMVKLLGTGLGHLDAAGEVEGGAGAVARGLAAFRAEVAAWREVGRQWADGGARPERAVPLLRLPRGEV